MRQAGPGVLLQKRLREIAETLGPLPHAKLNIENGPLITVAVDRPKKQRARMLKAECKAEEGCGYTVRISAKWVNELGPQLCPKHGPMLVDETPPDTESETEPETGDEDEQREAV